MSRQASFALNAYFLVVFVGIGGLQMYNVNAGFLTNYGADLLAPPWMYLAIRGAARQGSQKARALGRVRASFFRMIGSRPLGTLLFLLAACFLWEWMQRYDLSGTPLAITRGRFDPFDLLAYAVGLLVTYVGEIFWMRRLQLRTDENAA